MARPLSNALLGAISSSAFGNAPTFERNPYAKSEYGTQNKRVHQNECIWNDVPEYWVPDICDQADSE